jgi:hypothetical protein
MRLLNSPIWLMRHTNVIMGESGVPFLKRRPRLRALVRGIQGRVYYITGIADGRGSASRTARINSHVGGRDEHSRRDRRPKEHPQAHGRSRAGRDSRSQAEKIARRSYVRGIGGER